MFSCKTPENLLKDYVTIQMGKTISFSNSDISISFNDVFDGRCPKSVCYLCYGSKADITITVSNGNGKEKIDLEVTGCMDESEGPNSYTVVALGYEFCLVKLSPYPDLDPIDKKNYIAKIKVTKL